VECYSKSQGYTPEQDAAPSADGLSAKGCYTACGSTTRGTRQAHPAFIASFAANLVLASVSTQVLPERVAVHFGAGGAANAWGSTTDNALLMVGVDLLLFCSIWFPPRLIERVHALDEAAELGLLAPLRGRISNAMHSTSIWCECCFWKAPRRSAR
jgi:hypothetical protein